LYAAGKGRAAWRWERTEARAAWADGNETKKLTSRIETVQIYMTAIIIASAAALFGYCASFIVS
jgi:hypothetical protein